MITDHEFVGLRQWGMFPTADKPCQYRPSAHVAAVCGFPQGQHVRMCSAALNIAGQHYGCDLLTPHTGSHRNAAAEAIWDGPAA
ncbi:hypothetical protein [Mycobacterium sp. 1465703.0]|uniref:hypothetical protein n=1 Tax=Mycobacterium sp. 1465703.0 TaxID=1834078 RepID=UPI0007FD9C7E|nr:hypothetical protein [Mycobacterium sp. 1465703.0]OBI95569.1 hypothetical protein A5625_08115 [Mycobacterium sp. 1465703.0]